MSNDWNQRQHPPLHSLAGGVAGYFYDDIVRALGPERGKQFQEWMAGQTMTLYQGHSLVYAWDYARFLQGLPPDD